VNKNAKQPNSFVYRFVPTDPADLTAGGRLQVLQVRSIATPGTPITFHSGAADADIINQDQKDLYTYGTSFSTTWVTVHDTAVDGTAPFSANALAKAAGGTPMKRPENGVIRPGTDFREFYFTATGDTDNRTEAGSAYGGFGGVFKLCQDDPTADTGTLSLVYRGDQAHTGLDNVSFSTKLDLIAVEDAGDTLHTQRNAFDSAYDIELTTDYGAPGAPDPTRVLALGRDASATVDSQFLGMAGFQNEGDNEITGIHVSDGDAGVGGILGAKLPTIGVAGWRAFYTQQHGDNTTFEVFFGRR
jgi:secreted PhoX family phosphatase